MNTLLLQQYDKQFEDFEQAESEDLLQPQTNSKLNLKNKLKVFLKHIDQNHDSEDEGIEDYNLGGYHPVHIGQLLLNRYTVIQKLGWGHFSTVWLCKDFKHKTFVAIKIQKSSPNYMEAAFDQVQILQKCQKQIQSKKLNRDNVHVVSLLNSFIHKTPYGNHFCMVFEILRCNLLDILKRHDYKGIQMDSLQEVAKQILKGLDFLHRQCGIIHTDLKPQNVMICLSQQQINDIVQNGQLTKNQLFAERTEVFQNILNCNTQQSTCTVQVNNINLQGLTKTQKKNYKRQLKKKMKKNQDQKQNSTQIKTNNIDDLFNFKQGKIEFNRGDKLKIPFNIKIADLGNACWNHHHFSTEIQTRQYRSPQVILKQSYTSTADLWSFAVMMYEMLTGDFLFQPKKGATWTKNDDHLAQMQQLLGPFPSEFSLRGAKAKQYFNKNGTLKRIPELQFWPLHLVLTLKYKIKPLEAKRFADFLLPMLNPVPQKRISAYEALKSQWLYIPITDYRLTQQQYCQIKAQFNDNKPQMQFPFNYEQQQIIQCQNLSDVDENQDQIFISKPQVRMADIRLVDRSFTDLGYIGYSEGIQIQKLDSCANWQFN